MGELNDLEFESGVSILVDQILTVYDLQHASGATDTELDEIRARANEASKTALRLLISNPAAYVAMNSEAGRRVMEIQRTVEGIEVHDV